MISPYSNTAEFFIKIMRIKELLSPTLKALIVKQILLVSDIGNEKRGVLRIWILMLGCTGLRHQLNLVKTEKKKKCTSQAVLHKWQNKF